MTTRVARLSPPRQRTSPPKEHNMTTQPTATATAASASAARPTVVAVIPDSAAAIPVARAAARLAGPGGQVVLAVLVAVPGRGLSPATAPVGGAAVSSTAMSVAARAFPTLQAAGVAYGVEALAFRDDRQRSRRESRATKAVAECARQYGAVAAVGTGAGMAPWPADGCAWTVVDPRAGSLDALGPVLTEDGRARLEARAAWLREEVMPPLRDLLAEPGRDERVVADYERALEELVDLEGLLAEAGAIPPAAPGEVALGSRVLVRLGSGSEEVVRIVHPAEAFLDEERISAASPLAAALLGCRIGESVRVHAPRGAYECTVVGLLDETAPVGAAG
jgi:transcription elongation GreA/GreB family factor